MPNYAYASLQDAVNALGIRLYDQNFNFWTQAELSLYVIEALRTWNALSQFWRGQMAIALTEGEWWYDLTQQNGTLVPFGVSQLDLITLLEYHLLEPPTTTYPLTWTGTTQFTLADLLIALQRRQDETLGTTACTLSRATYPASSSSVRTVLSDSTIDIRRVAWMPAGGPNVNKILRQSDIWAERSFNHGYWNTSTPSPPWTWMQNAEPPPSFDVNVLPPTPSNYEVITVNAGAPWNATGNAILNVPTDWTWVVKWGALFDLLSKEEWAKDSPRAQYCLARFQEGLAFLRTMPTVLTVAINNVPYTLDALRNGDDFNASWQAQLEGPPNAVYGAANLLAFAPMPDQNFWQANVTVVQNAPVPALMTDYIQVARDDFDTIVDYAQHLAMFKTGGAEFQATIPLYAKLQQRAALYNGKLKEMGFFEMTQADQSTLEEYRNPRYQKGSEPQASSKAA